MPDAYGSRYELFRCSFSSDRSAGNFPASICSRESATRRHAAPTGGIMNAVMLCVFVAGLAVIAGVGPAIFLAPLAAILAGWLAG